MTRSPGRLPAAAASMMYLTACVSWQPLPPPVVDGLTAARGETVRVTGPGYEEEVLWEFGIRADTLHGNRDRTRRSCMRDLDACELHLPLSDVRYVDVRRFDLVRTLAIPGVVVGGVLLGLLIDRVCENESSC